MVTVNRAIRRVFTPLFNRLRPTIDRVVPAFGRSSVRFASIGVATAVLATGAVVPALANVGPFADSAAPADQSAPAAVVLHETAQDQASRSKPAPAAAAKPPVAKKVVKAPTAKQLHPRGINAGQQSFTPSAEQMRNAKAIVKVGQALKLPPRAWVIAVATSCQESTLHNYGNLGARNDHDSLGLFQQRPASGWGSPKQLTNPNYAATAFYKSLVKVPGWNKLPLTQAAQTVQVSAFPDHYAKWEKQAGNLVLATYGVGPYAKTAASVK